MGFRAMSLINKMLQDLDARANKPGAAAVPSDTRPVLPPEPRMPWMRPALAGGVALVVAAGGAAAWYLLRQPQAPVVAQAPAPKPAPAPAPATPIAVEIPVAPKQEEPKQEELLPQPPKAEAPVVEKPRAAPQPKPKKVAPTPAKTAPAKPAAGKVETATQRAENAYRRALTSLEDGRVTEAIAGLQTALRIDPRHEPSRQTLVGLLIEAKRHDEAMRQLQAALTLDARQPAMAMLLARLQVERGGPAVDTLMRTLPYAAGNGEYHAFLAGVLQREQRHREAAEHYQVALRAAPQNGVWWMGLGISLQADKRDAEAATAYRRAQASGALSPELQTFVERKLRQLGR
jgi:MSHA biogenesis protein MshN